jgi:uncharacterized damage-inducible protein DinB
VSVPFPEPTAPAGSRAEVLGRYLDYFRDRVAAKLRELPEGELRRSRLPSGWAPLELLKHLTAMERRWLEWGFAGRAVAGMQEYARHLGQLDIACELAGGTPGE